METLVDGHMPVNSDDSMKIIFGDQRLWPSVIVRLQKCFPVGTKSKYDIMVVRNNIFSKEYILSRTLTDQKRRRGKDVSGKIDL